MCKTSQHYCFCFHTKYQLLMQKKPFKITIINLVSFKMSGNVEACSGNLVFPVSCPSGNLPKTRFFDLCKDKHLFFLSHILHDKTVCNSTGDTFSITNPARDNLNIANSIERYDHEIEDILQEFYPKGSDCYFQYTYIRDMYMEFEYSTGMPYYLPSPDYLTYILCTLPGKQVSAQNITNVLLFTCGDGSVIPDVLLCNGMSDCKNAELG